ncbi:LytR/AlgR family response regulator transcription factor [Bacteroidota bacterium]
MNENTLRAVIIDDESKAISNLSKIIIDFCNEVDVVGTASGVSDGINIIKQLDPDLIFLDIQMPDGSGFDILERLDKRNFDVIFVTSYNQHAIRAFKYSATDYLLKPIDIDDLNAAVKRVIAKRINKEPQENYQELFNNLQYTIPQKIGISSMNGKDYVSLESIIRMEAKGSYTSFILENNKNLLASKRIKEFEELLPEKSFLRIHNSHIINLIHVKRYTKSDGGWITLSDDSKVPLARRRKDLFESLMNKMSK